MEAAAVALAAGAFAAFGLFLGAIDNDHPYFTSDWGEVARKVLRKGKVK